ncbi:MAG: HPF/RaiA family ribosome-associated protein [Bdellovibrionaceae bacterium]|nr:HPF/RaiA family ribosome-associated protein [Pseudobdellovibrionaceae bacterium]
MAQLKIRFVNFERSIALEEYTQKHIEGLMRRLDRRPGQTKSIEVQFRLDARAPLGTLKNSEVMISYRYPGVKKILHVKKTGADLRKVLNDAIHAAETVIQRESEKSEGGRRTLGKSKHLVRSLRQVKE